MTSLENQLAHAETLAAYDARIAAIEDNLEHNRREYEADQVRLDEIRENMSNTKKHIDVFNNLLLKAQKNREAAAAGKVTKLDYDIAYLKIAGGADPQEVRKVFQERFPSVTNTTFRSAMYRRRVKEA